MMCPQSSADGSFNTPSTLPCPGKIKDAWSRQGSSFLARTHKSVCVCVCETMTFFLIGIELFFPGEKNVDMPLEDCLPRKSPDAQRKHAVPSL